MKAKGKDKQIAALPFRIGSEDQPEVLLVTSRETGRWIIPKGWPIKNRKPHEAAAQAAFEEAGLRGEVAKEALSAAKSSGSARPATSSSATSTFSR